MWGTISARTQRAIVSRSSACSSSNGGIEARPPLSLITLSMAPTYVTYIRGSRVTNCLERCTIDQCNPSASRAHPTGVERSAARDTSRADFGTGAMEATTIDEAAAAAVDGQQAGEAVFSLELSDDQRDIRDWVHGVAECIVRPPASAWDEREETTWS